MLLLELLHTVCQRAAKWFEGCACHDDCFRDFNEEHAAAYTSAVRSHDKGCVDGPAYTRHNGCRFASKRTWEMAHGVLDGLIAGWIGEGSPAVVTDARRFARRRRVLCATLTAMQQCDTSLLSLCLESPPM